MGIDMGNDDDWGDSEYDEVEDDDYRVDGIQGNRLLNSESWQKQDDHRSPSRMYGKLFFDRALLSGNPSLESSVLLLLQISPADLDVVNDFLVERDTH